MKGRDKGGEGNMYTLQSPLEIILRAPMYTYTYLHIGKTPYSSDYVGANKQVAHLFSTDSEIEDRKTPAEYLDAV